MIINITIPSGLQRKVTIATIPLITDITVVTTVIIVVITPTTTRNIVTIFAIIGIAGLINVTNLPKPNKIGSKTGFINSNEAFSPSITPLTPPTIPVNTLPISIPLNNAPTDVAMSVNSPLRLSPIPFSFSIPPALPKLFIILSMIGLTLFIAFTKPPENEVATFSTMAISGYKAGANAPNTCTTLFPTVSFILFQRLVPCCIRPKSVLAKASFTLPTFCSKILFIIATFSVCVACLN